MGTRPIAVLVLFLLAVLASCSGADKGAPAIPASETAPPAGSPVRGSVRITYYGHAMFTIATAGGVTILTDPNDGIGYRAPSGEVDIVTISHEHPDHNKTDVASNARVIRGLTEGGDWAQIDETIGDLRIWSLPSYHDASQGADRGMNSVFVFDIGRLRVVHAGDLGLDLASLAEESTERWESLVSLAVEGVDALLVPVGGHFTIGAQEADRGDRRVAANPCHPDALSHRIAARLPRCGPAGGRRRFHRRKGQRAAVE